MIEARQVLSKKRFYAYIVMKDRIRQTKGKYGTKEVGMTDSLCPVLKIGVLLRFTRGNASTEEQTDRVRGDPLFLPGKTETFLGRGFDADAVDRNVERVRDILPHL